MSRSVSIDQLCEMADAYRAKIVALSARKEALQEKLTAMDREVTEAAQAGDLALYRGKKGHADELREELFVCTEQLDTMQNSPAVDPELARQTWAAFAEKHSAKQMALLAQISKLKRQFCDVYAELIANYENALDLRDKLGRDLNIKHDFQRDPKNYNLRNSLPLDPIPFRDSVNTNPAALLKVASCNLRDPDAAYFLSQHLIDNPPTGPVWEDPMVMRVNRIVAAHEP